MPAPAHATHATLATFRVDLEREVEQREGLERMILPSVTAHRGFVAGTWTLDRDASESLVMLTYESREAAESMKRNIIGNAENQQAVGLELLGVRLLEVAATAAAES